MRRVKLLEFVDDGGKKGWLKEDVQYVNIFCQIPLEGCGQEHGHITEMRHAFFQLETMKSLHFRTVVTFKVFIGSA